jgi:hypothetical protein
MVNFFTDTDLIGAGEFLEATVSLATEYTLPAGTIASVRSKFPAVAGATVLMRIYNASGTLLASASAFDTTTVDAWNTATISGGLTISASTIRVVIVVTRYIALGGFFSGGAITRGSIQANRGLSDSGDVAPATASNTSYFCDIDFTAGSGPVAATAALTASSVLSATGIRTQLPTAALAAVSTLTAGATRVQPATAALAAVSTLTAAATRITTATAALAAVSTMTASAGALVPATAALAAVSTLTAAATRDQPATATLTAVATLSASGTRAAAGTVALTASPDPDRGRLPGAVRRRPR